MMAHMDRAQFGLPRGHRRGITFLMVIAVMIVAAIVSLSILGVLMTDRQVLRREEARLQAQWLATAGLERAAARLQANSDYRGDTWTIEPNELGKPLGGSVATRIEPQARGYAVTVRAEAGRLGGQPVRITQTIHVDRLAEGENR